MCSVSSSLSISSNNNEQYNIQSVLQSKTKPTNSRFFLLYPKKLKLICHQENYYKMFRSLFPSLIDSDQLLDDNSLCEIFRIKHNDHDYNAQQIERKIRLIANRKQVFFNSLELLNEECLNSDGIIVENHNQNINIAALCYGTNSGADGRLQVHKNFRAKHFQFLWQQQDTTTATFLNNNIDGERDEYNRHRIMTYDVPYDDRNNNNNNNNNNHQDEDVNDHISSSKNDTRKPKPFVFPSNIAQPSGIAVIQCDKDQVDKMTQFYENKVKEMHFHRMMREEDLYNNNNNNNMNNVNDGTSGRSPGDGAGANNIVNDEDGVVINQDGTMSFAVMTDGTTVPENKNNRQHQTPGSHNNNNTSNNYNLSSNRNNNTTDQEKEEQSFNEEQFYHRRLSIALQFAATNNRLNYDCDATSFLFLPQQIREFGDDDYEVVKYMPHEVITQPGKLNEYGREGDDDPVTQGISSRLGFRWTGHSGRLTKEVDEGLLLDAFCKSAAAMHQQPLTDDQKAIKLREWENARNHQFETKEKDFCVSISDVCREIIDKSRSSNAKYESRVDEEFGAVSCTTNNDNNNDDVDDDDDDNAAADDLHQNNDERLLERKNAKLDGFEENISCIVVDTCGLEGADNKSQILHLLNCLNIFIARRKSQMKKTIVLAEDGKTQVVKVVPYFNTVQCLVLVNNSVINLSTTPDFYRQQQMSSSSVGASPSSGRTNNNNNNNNDSLFHNGNNLSPQRSLFNNNNNNNATRDGQAKKNHHHHATTIQPSFLDGLVNSVVIMKNHRDLFYTTLKCFSYSPDYHFRQQKIENLLMNDDATDEDTDDDEEETNDGDEQQSGNNNNAASERVTEDGDAHHGNNNINTNNGNSSRMRMMMQQETASSLRKKKRQRRQEEKENQRLMKKSIFGINLRMKTDPNRRDLVKIEVV